MPSPSTSAASTMTACRLKSTPATMPSTRVWRRAPPIRRTTWPALPRAAAYYGLAGDIVRAIEPHSEADPVALLVQVLTAFGSIIGRRAHFIAEDDRHFPNLFAVLMGRTSKGRKGSSWGRVCRLMDAVDAEWAAERVQSGLSSGEGLIWAVRIQSAVTTKRRGSRLKRMRESKTSIPGLRGRIRPRAQEHRKTRQHPECHHPSSLGYGQPRTR